MNRIVYAAVVAMSLIAGCERAEDAASSAVRETGKIAGKGLAEFATGVGEGVRSVTNDDLPDVITAIATRKSVRRFDASRPVDDALVEKLLRAAMAAPTAVDCRPWEFVVVKDEGTLKALADAHPNSRISNGATLVICVCGSLDNGLPGRGKEYWIQDCSAATENLLLAAHGYGLGAVWCGVWPIEERVTAIKSILGIPDGFAPLCLVTIGYPAENPEVKDKWNPAKVHNGRW